MKMLVEIQRWIKLITVILLTVNLLCEGRSNSHLLEAVNQFENLSQTYKAENESDQMTLDYFHVVKGILIGIDTAVKECKNQFMWDLWNCPVESSALLTKTFVSRTTKETAYVQAIAAAGIMYHVTKKCNHPENSFCGCNSKAYKEMFAIEDKRAASGSVTWTWRGCLQNLMFGEKVSQTFLGTTKGSKSPKQAMIAHNELVGLEAVTSSIKIQCKCLGRTGSCTIKTCWRILPDFSYIASKLKMKYKRAKSVKSQNAAIPADNNIRQRRYKNVPRGALVYSEISPDYCKPDTRNGYQGTRGRECIRLEKGENKSTMSKWERNTCKRLCKDCGYSVGRHAVMESETYNCGCTPQFCCTVKCNRCQKNVWRYFCE